MAWTMPGHSERPLPLVILPPPLPPGGILPHPLRRFPAPSARRPGFRCDALEPRVLLAAAMVTDINPSTPASNPHTFVDLNGTLLFRADDGVHGQDWWRA